MIQWNFSCEAAEHLFLHQANQSRLDLIILSSAGKRIYGGASGREVPRKVPLSNGSALVLSLLCSKFSRCLVSSFLCVDGLLHLLHLLLHERHCSSEIISPIVVLVGRGCWRLCLSNLASSSLLSVNNGPCALLRVCLLVIHLDHSLKQREESKLYVRLNIELKTKGKISCPRRNGAKTWYTKYEPFLLSS